MNKSRAKYGFGRVFKRHGKPEEWDSTDRNWHIEYYHRGKSNRESTGTTNRAQASKLLKQRLAEISTGKFIGPSENKLNFDALAEMLVNDYEINLRRSKATIGYFIKHLQKFFGSDRALDITPDRVKVYQSHRLAEKASRATANREVAALSRMLSLAIESGKLSRKHKFKLLDGERVREGFLEHGEYLTLLTHLPEYVKPVVEFLYYSGWRKGEALSLEWKDVDLRGEVVTLRIENSKTKESRTLPLTNRLLDLIQERHAVRRLDCPYVFHNEGQRIGDFKKSWKTACKKSGLEGTLVHDLRRCAARNLSRSDVPESVAMKLTGHKTNSMYRRYRIVDERDLREATEKMQAHLNEQPTAPRVVRMAVNKNK